MRTRLAERPVVARSAAKPRPRPQTASPAALELQRSAGNAAVTGLLQRQVKDLAPKRPKIPKDVVFMAGEQVRVKNKAEQHEAEQILVEIRNKYGIRLSSPMAMAGLYRETKEFAGDTKDLRGVGYTVWTLPEIRALREGLKRFDPILGKKRQQSTRKGKWQEVTSIGKLTADNGKVKDLADGETFRSVKNVALFESATGHPGSYGDFKDQDEYLAAVVIHELTHALMEYAQDDWEKSLSWWEDRTGEAPINSYANTNLDEDLSESVAYYFLEPDTLRNGTGGKPGEIGNPCRKRFALVDKYVKAWQPRRS